jgi:hypothetical protein
LLQYNRDPIRLDTVLQLTPEKPFTSIDYMGVYNTFGYLVVLGDFYSGRRYGNGTYNAMLKILDLNTLHVDSIVVAGGVSAGSNLVVPSAHSAYYCVRLMTTHEEKGFNRDMQSRIFTPEDYNSVYIQGSTGTAIDDRESLRLYNEKSNSNALHISKGYGWKVGPYLELQPPKELYNAYSPALKAMIVNDSHCTIITYGGSTPDGNRIGEKYCLVHDKQSKEWYKQTFRGNYTSSRSYDNGWVAGTIGDKDKGKYFDNTTMRSGAAYNFKREIPGYGERVPIFHTRTDGIWGDCFDERAQSYGTYYPGLLYLFNVHTKDYIEWDTRQGDSEVLLVQDGSVYYRVNTKILRSGIVNGRELSEPELLIDDARVRDIHWAYIKKHQQ